MKRRTVILLLLLALFAAVGLLDSLIIHLKEIKSATDPSVFEACNIGKLLNCASVAKSSYAKFLGMPVSLLGALFYQASLVGSLCLLLGFKPQPWVQKAITAILILSLFFSFRLLYLSYFGLGVFCIYCLVSNLTTLGIFSTWLLYTKTSK
jgi:uncharacterized membrane protein